MHSHIRCRLLNLEMITGWMVPLLFSPEDMASISTEQFSTQLKSILNEHWPKEDICISRSCRKLRQQMAWFTIISGSVPEPCSDFHDESFLLLVQFQLITYKYQAASIDFWLCPLSKKISLDYLNLQMMRYSKSLQFYFEKHNMQIGGHLPIFTSEKLCFSKSLFLFPVLLLTCYYHILSQPFISPYLHSVFIYI